MPLRYEGGVWWVRAHLTTKLDRAGLWLDTVADQLGRGDGEYSIDQAAGTGEFGPLARSTLSEVIPPDEDLAFDPTLHTAAGKVATRGDGYSGDSSVSSAVVISGPTSREAIPPSPP
ncbi:MAG: hypothetical protein SV966_14550 [Actinomycetota bacterium]|nr:hypothetical protein [Actinomycetota bacterium]